MGGICSNVARQVENRAGDGETRFDVLIHAQITRPITDDYTSVLLSGIMPQ